MAPMSMSILMHPSARLDCTPYVCTKIYACCSTCPCPVAAGDLSLGSFESINAQEHAPDLFMGNQPYVGFVDGGGTQASVDGDAAVRDFILAAAGLLSRTRLWSFIPLTLWRQTWAIGTLIVV